MNPQGIISSSKRKKYLFETIKLAYDPFAYTSTEQEFQQSNPEDPPFYSYFVNPITEAGEDLLSKLREPTTSFVYGKAGSGKTAVAYMLDALCRSAPDQTLAVFAPIGKTGQLALSADELWRSLTEALAVDLFVQLVEQIHMLPDVGQETVRQLAEFWYATIPSYGRGLRRHLAPNSDGLLPKTISRWNFGYRPTVRYTPLTAERINFLQQLLAYDSEIKESNSSAKTLFADGVALAKSVGFQQIFILLDVANNIQIETEQLKEYLRLLFDEIGTFSSSIPLYAKCFFPLDWQEHINSLKNYVSQLTGNAFFAIMTWQSPDALKSIIENRFYSARSRVNGFHTIAQQEIANKLDERIFATADYSPRRLLQIATLLIDIHAQKDPNELLITAADWDDLCAAWGNGAPHPLPFDDSREKGESPWILTPISIHTPTCCLTHVEPTNKKSIYTVPKLEMQKNG